MFNSLYSLLKYGFLVFLMVANMRTTEAQLVNTFAGSGAPNLTDGTGISASFFEPVGMTLDQTGNVFICDASNHVIRKATPSGVITTFAGTGNYGNTNGSALSASFNYPTGIAIDAGGNLFIADSENHLIRKISSTGMVSTFAGSGIVGSADGIGTAASFNYPSDIVIDATGNLFVSDKGNNSIRKITPTAEVSTYAGSGTQGFADGLGIAASFNHPSGLTIDLFGDVYVADYGNDAIRKISFGGEVSTLTLNSTIHAPSGITFDQNLNLLVVEESGHKVSKISNGEQVSTLAGSGNIGSLDGFGVASSFHFPSKVLYDGSNGLYVTDKSNNKIRKITLLPEIKVSQGTTELLSGIGSYDFGNVSEQSSQTVSFNIENLDSAQRTLFLTGSPKVVLSGIDANQFSIDESNTSSSINVGGITTFTITFSPTSLGNKMANVSIQNNDFDEATYTFTVMGSGVINTNTLNSRTHLFTISPNPSDNILTIESKEKLNLSIYDSKGKVLTNQVIPISGSQISIGQLKSGLYIFRCTNEAGRFQEIKIIKE